MAKFLVIDPVQFTHDTRKLYDMELGALMRALVESVYKDGAPVNIRDASFFGQDTNGFFHIEADDVISASSCRFAFITSPKESN